MSRLESRLIQLQEMRNSTLESYLFFVQRLLSLSRKTKNILVMMTDYIVLVFSFWSSLSIRINDFYVASGDALLLIIVAPFIALPIFYSFGLYQSFIRYANYRALITLIFAVSIYTLLWFIVVLVSDLIDKPYDFLIINWLTTIFFIGGIRYIARWLLSIKGHSTDNVLIYGAGSAGIQLYSTILHNPDMKTVAFVDDNMAIQGKYIEGLMVYAKSNLSKIIEKKAIKEILVAIPSMTRIEKLNLLQGLKGLPVVIRMLPSLSDVTAGRVSISDLKKVKIDDLLKRESRKPDPNLLRHDIDGMNILVTGAGGSIGSELCREIIKLGPGNLVLFDISEYALYLLEAELLEEGLDIELITIIGNVTNQERLEQIITKHKIDTIYHAAAYKHVPMVEKNILAGVRCNIFGTLSCCNAAIKKGVKSLVFISTDKAVRPTNIMGATKRFAEMILQSMAKNHENESTRISIVRFGNVLGSSGSVVPLFRKQIRNGGPVTVTDPEIIRYFMTLKESAQLVIQAGAMGKYADIFLLDMDKPVKVVDLARDMIQLSGRTVRDNDNPEGDIEIIFTGLRPGEKLFEELLIDEKSKTTKHPKIMQALEKHLGWDEIKEIITEIEVCTKEEDLSGIKSIFLESVDGYNPK